ncbi:hypothetical protein BDK62_103415 [Halomonas alkaliantarctica]|jgi:hypothetical protein|nr:hypothetical protein BDK62_103415 [Halomonas alkaliantarctica]
MLAENLENWAPKERYQGIESTLRKQIILKLGENFPTGRIYICSKRVMLNWILWWRNFNGQFT